MKTCEQMAKDVLTRRDALLRRHRKNRRHAAVISTAAGSFTVVMLLGYGASRQLNKTNLPPLSDSTVIGENDLVSPEDGESNQDRTESTVCDCAGPDILTDRTNAQSFVSSDNIAIEINEMTTSIPALRLSKSTLDGWNEEWLSYDELTAYFGRDLRPVTLPAGMQAETDLAQRTYRIYTDKETGEVAHDLQQLSFCAGFYPADSEWAGVPIGAYDGGKEITVTVTKAERLFRDYVYWFEDDEVKTSRIYGVEVVIRHRVEGSKYDKNHNPTVTWDRYVATFRTDGILYEVVTDNLTVEELITVIKNYV